MGERGTRADGEVLDLTIDGQTWDELADALVTFMEDWPATLGSRLTIVRDAARCRKRLANELNLAKAAEREAVVAARAAGATGYKLSKITGLGQTTISRWTREKGHQSEDKGRPPREWGTPQSVCVDGGGVQQGPWQAGMRNDDRQRVRTGIRGPVGEPSRSD